MIGAAVFVVSFVLSTLISLAIDLPPGIWVHDWCNIPKTEYASLINGIMNGVGYGVIIWLSFSLVKMARERRKKKIVRGEINLKVHSNKNVWCVFYVAKN